MTDPTLTPEIYGDFDMHLANVRDQQAPLVIEVGDVIFHCGGSDRCIHVEDGYAWCISEPRSPDVVIPAYVWKIDGTPVSLASEADHYRAVAIKKAVRHG